MVFLIVFVLMGLTEIALGQTSVGGIEKTFLATLLDGAFVAKLIPVVVGIQIILYGLAEGLTRLSVITSNTWDNKLAGWLSDASWVMGVVIGKFGYSVPKLVIEEKALISAEPAKPTEPPKSA